MDPPELPLRHHAEIVAPPGLVLANASIGPDDELVSLWVDPADLAAGRPVRAVVEVQHAEYQTRVEIEELPFAFAFASACVQPMPDGRVLVVSAHCRWSPTDPDRNAIIYDADGQPQHSATLGDDIAHVQVTRRGKVWVGYGDEGVFGNRGWGGRGAAQPIGASGLVRFDADLVREWEFHGGPAIIDCYALNVDGEDAWACYYTEFPVARVRADRVTHWSNRDCRYARALAARGDRVLLCADRVVIGLLADGSFVKTGEWQLGLPGVARIVGRGPDLHVLTSTDWHRCDLGQV